MERLQIKIAGNGLEARLHAVAGPAATLDELMAALQSAGVVHGLDDDAIATVARQLEDPGAAIDVVIARGSAPEAGTAGCLRGELLAAREAGHARADASIDYRERTTLHPVAAGAPVAEIVPPTPGKPGRSVLGRALPCKPGRPHAQREGPGVRRQGDVLVAARDGVILASERKVDVVDLYTHSGDVDYDSGNLHSKGSLVVKGDVRAGFRADADGDIEVAGAVLDGAVDAGGSVRVGQGVLGQCWDRPPASAPASTSPAATPRPPT